MHKFNALGDQTEKIQIPITGNIPNYVAGTLYRNGPGGYKVPRADSKDGYFSVSHWFDGFTTVHKFELEPGTQDISKAYYSSRCLVDEAIEKARKTGKLDGITFAQKRDPCDTLYNKFKSTFEPTLAPTIGTTNINVTMREVLPAELKSLNGADKGRKIISLGSDNARTEQIDADTLEPLGIANQAMIHPRLKGSMSAAHAARDPDTGDVFNYNLDFGPTCTYRVFRAEPATGKVDILAEFADKDTKPSYLHSMFITENFVVLCIWPAYYSAYGINLLVKRNILEALSPFDYKAETAWVVIDRRHSGGVVKKFKSPGFFCFHTTNAWEEARDNGTVDLHCELVEFKDMSILHRLYYENVTSTGKGVYASYSKHREAWIPNLTRYRLAAVPLTKTDPSKGTAEKLWQIETPDAGDLPQINPRFATRAHRYVWSTLDQGNSSFLDGLGKTDTQTRTCIRWEARNHTPGEPVFIPNPAGTAEDDGVVLSVICDGDRGTSYLLCLDARTMQELGRVDVGRAVGLGFHGMHIPAARS